MLQLLFELLREHFGRGVSKLLPPNATLLTGLSVHKHQWLFSECVSLCLCGLERCWRNFLFQTNTGSVGLGSGLIKTSECKTWPGGNKAPANSGSAWLHRFKPPNITSLYDWPHTASKSLVHNKPVTLKSSFPGPLHPVPPFAPPFLEANMTSEEWPWPVLSLAPWALRELCRYLSDSHNILFPGEVEKGKNTWISVRDYYC